MHNVENYMAAIAAVSGLVSKEVIVNVAKLSAVWNTELSL